MKTTRNCQFNQHQHQLNLLFQYNQRQSFFYLLKLLVNLRELNQNIIVTHKKSEAWKMEKPMHSIIAILPGILRVFSQDRAE